MWGAGKGNNYNNFLKEELDKVFKDMISESGRLYKLALLRNNKGKGIDQTLLARRVWPYAKNDSVIHDSYTCHKRGLRGTDIRPFPTKRLQQRHNYVGDYFVGKGEITVKKHGACPVQCRPKEHQDWLIC